MPPPPDGFTADGRPVRKVRNPELDGEGDLPPIGASPRRALSFDVNPKKRRSGTWLVLAAVGLFVALGLAGAISWWRDRPRPRPTVADAKIPRARQDALGLLARDDGASLERAAALLDDSARREKTAGALADRALALAVLAQQASEEAQRLEGRARSVGEQRQAAEASGDVARASDLADQLDALRAGVAPAQARSRRLAAEARAELESIPGERERDPVVLRARAMALVAGGERAEAQRIAREARGVVADPWLALAGALADLPEDAGADEHGRALERLEKLAASHPELVRARFLAARIRAGIGDVDGALAGFDAVLAANPDHLEARRLRSELAGGAASSGPGSATPPAPREAPKRAAPREAPPAEHRDAQPRKTVTQGRPD